jgi:hypothetical protein
LRYLKIQATNDFVDSTVTDMWTNGTYTTNDMSSPKHNSYCSPARTFSPGHQVSPVLDENAMLMQTNGVASHYQSPPDVASTSYYPTAWYPELTPTLCLPTPCAPCYTSINTILRSFPYPIIQEPLTVSVIPYITFIVNGSRLTSFVTSTQYDRFRSNTTNVAIQLYETFTWMERNVTM